MPDDLDDDFDELDDEQPEDDALVKRLRKAQRDAKKEAKALRDEAETGRQAKKELVKLQAELPDTPMVKLFLDNYDGDYTKDAIKAKALEYGLIQPDPADQEREVQIGDVERMMQAHSGGTTPPPPGSDDPILQEIANVKPGENAAFEIQKILQAAGRWEPED